MRPRRKLWYSVTSFDAPSIWYDREYKKWINTQKTPRGSKGCSNTQECRTFRAAKRAFENLKRIALEDYPDAEIILNRFYRKHGERWCQEFYYKKPVF